MLGAAIVRRYVRVWAGVLVLVVGSVVRADEPGGSSPRVREQVLRGRALEDAGRWEDARLVLESVQEGCRALAAPERVSCIEALASVLLKLRRLDEVTALLEPARSGASSATRWELLARLSRERGHYAAARDLAVKAVRAREEDDPHDPSLVHSYRELADAEWFLGHLDVAHAWYQRAGEHGRRLGPAEGPARAAGLAAWAFSEYQRGDLAAARQHEREAVEIARRVRGAFHPETLTYEHDLGTFDHAAGDYPAALAAYERFHASKAAGQAPESDEVATVLFNIGELRLEMGDAAGAREAGQAALLMWEKVMGREHPFTAIGREALARAEEKDGRRDAALALYEQAARIWEHSTGPASLELAYVLVSQAALSIELGRTERAAELIRRARAMTAAAPPDDRRGAMLLAGIAATERARGEWAACASGLLTAVSRLEAGFGSEHPQVGRLRAQRAQCLARLGSPLARQEALRADAIWRKHVRRTARYLAEGQAVRLGAQPPEARDAVLALALAGDAAPEDALDVVVRGRALVLDEMAARQRTLRASATPALDDVRSEFDREASRLAQLLYRDAAEPAPERQSAIAAAKARLDALEQRMFGVGARPGVSREDVSGQEVLRLLPPGAALVSFVRFAHEGSKEGRAPMRYLAIAATRRGARLHDLGPAPPIEAAVREWRRMLGDLEAAVSPLRGTSANYFAAGARVRQLVFDPLQADLKGHPLVFIVPDGAISLIPWAALPVDARRFLVDAGPTMQLLSTERDLAFLASDPPIGSQALLAVGGPDFDVVSGAPMTVAEGIRRRGDGERCRSGPASFRPLPGAALEAVEVARRWPRGATEVLLGPNAEEGAFRARAPHAGLLHLATHGFFSDPWGCGAKPGAWASSLNPLVTSGLALAGANRAGLSNSGHDGLLTSAELATLDLSGTSWAVLSACGSGLGRVEDGEGVLGLQRALSIAGVRTVIMSLADVDDSWTRRLMNHLYAHRFGRGLAAPQALRAAQRDLVAELRAAGRYPHPALWGTFVSAGDWR